MNVIHLGSGARTRRWIEAADRYSGARSVALVADGAAASGSRVPVFASLEDALEAVSADVAVVSGNAGAQWAVRALASGIAVLMDETGVMDEAAFAELRDAALAGGAAVVWPNRYRYARCERVLRRLIGSGRLGGIGHVSCIDHSISPGEGARQVSAIALGHFQSLERLFGARIARVMARLDARADGRSSTEAFLELDGGLHIHYSGYLGVERNAHELWIEGSDGSLRTDGGAVWWRKRGWRFFAPLRFGAALSVDDAGQARAAFDALAEGRRAATDLTPVAAVAAALASDRRRSAVALAELLPH